MLGGLLSQISNIAKFVVSLFSGKEGGKQEGQKHADPDTRHFDVFREEADKYAKERGDYFEKVCVFFYSLFLLLQSSTLLCHPISPVLTPPPLCLSLL